MQQAHPEYQVLISCPFPPPPPAAPRPIYLPQSSSDKPLTIFGAGFKGEPVLNFDPPIWSPANYTLEVASDTELKLSLVKGSMWNKFPGALLLKGINVGDGDVSIYDALLIYPQSSCVCTSCLPSPKVATRPSEWPR